MLFLLPNIQLFSKFCSFLPKWCVTVGSSGTYSVCVCVTYQNAILLLDAIDMNKKYTDLMDMIVCDWETKQCIIQRCEKCPGTEPLKMFLFDALEKDEDDVCFQQWQATDRTKLVSQTISIGDFVDLVIETIDSLTTHSLIAKMLRRLRSALSSLTIHLLSHAIDVDYV